uniref:Uncharacterized protein n=1 Tax=Ananas comosus var. bracteatus TaxID=296719 RepID=A0A6V7NQX6_ANACO|nr:unnamed protein product [Ananas comosus var. bracteatus]
MTETKEKHSANTDSLAQCNEWDEATCSICMDHPHNAVLLICTSHDEGCRPFICNTSHRHSNCLDRFRKMIQKSQLCEPNPQERNNVGESSNGVDTLVQNYLNCPLCRGNVTGWTVIKEARHYMDLKVRSCSREFCHFSGNYAELRSHARRAHPAARPADVDASRLRTWRQLELRREHGDVLSAIRSAMPGAIVLGDYVIDIGDEPSEDYHLDDGNGAWWSTLMNHMISNSVSSSRARRTHQHSAVHRNWMEIDGDDYGNLENNETWLPRRRRRFRRSREERS